VLNNTEAPRGKTRAPAGNSRWGIEEGSYEKFFMTNSQHDYLPRLGLQRCFRTGRLPGQKVAAIKESIAQKAGK
jgi:hypothetical protein